MSFPPFAGAGIVIRRLQAGKTGFSRGGVPVSRLCTDCGRDTDLINQRRSDGEVYCKWCLGAEEGDDGVARVAHGGES